MNRKLEWKQIKTNSRCETLHSNRTDSWKLNQINIWLKHFSISCALAHSLHSTLNYFFPSFFKCAMLTVNWLDVLGLSFIQSQFYVGNCLLKKLSIHQRSVSCSSQKHNSKWISFHLILCSLVERHMTYARTFLVTVSITHMKDFIRFLTNLYTSVRDSGNPILWPLQHLFLSVIWLRYGRVEWNFSLHQFFYTFHFL